MHHRNTNPAVCLGERRGDRYTLRVWPPHGALTSDQAEMLGRVARDCGEGEIRLTMHGALEVTGVAATDLPAATLELSVAGLAAATSSTDPTQVTACSGAESCPNAVADAARLAMQLERQLAQVRPSGGLHVAVSACPNGCSMPRLADVGFAGAVMPKLLGGPAGGEADGAFACPDGAVVWEEGRPLWLVERCGFCGRCVDRCETGGWGIARLGYMAYVGGSLGRRPRLGLPLAEFLSEDEAVQMAYGIASLMAEMGRPGEPLWALIERVGLDCLRKRVGQTNPHGEEGV